jgi:phospholipase C
MQAIRRVGIISAAGVLLAACAGSPSAPVTSSAPLARIQNIVVIYAENHSFDNMYGMFPGANGIANATAAQKTQLDFDGSVLPHLPPVYDGKGKPDPRFPTSMPNGPFRMELPPVNAKTDTVLLSPIHQYYHNIEQINGGRNDRFVAMGNSGSWTMGYVDGSGFRMWKWAQDYTLADNFFMGAFGGSFLNHQWLICACTPVFTDAPASMRAQLDENGRIKKKPTSPRSVLEGPVQVFDGSVSPDGYAVNTSQPPFQPSGYAPAAGGDLHLADRSKFPIPPQTSTTIGDTLSAKGVSWTWFSGGWKQALADGEQAPEVKRDVIYSRTEGSPMFQPHHQPFNYFARCAPGTADRALHLKDGDEMLTAIDQGTLPQVSFYKPAGRYTQHPSYTDLQSGDRHIADLLERLKKSPQWNNMVVIVTYDENGGYWDHVPPPSGPGWGDRWGPGSRIPTMVISPFAKRGFIDHTSNDTTSILKLITRRFDLAPLPGVRANVGDLTTALELGN